MDPEAHRRFLEYIERWEYFGGAASPRLPRGHWLALDSERLPLEDKARTETCTSEDLLRLRLLRRALLID